MVTVTVGAPFGFTVTVNEVVAVLFASSLAVHVTVVVPTGALTGDGGTHVTVTDGSTASVAVGVLYVTVSPGAPRSGTVMLGGVDVKLGGVLSTALCVRESDVEAWESVAVHFTVSDSSTGMDAPTG